MQLQGSFEPQYVGNEPAAPLRGAGTVELSPHGVCFRCHIERVGMITALSVVTAIIAMLVVVVAVVVLGEEFAVAVPLKFGAVLGLGGLVLGFEAGFALLERVIPQRSFEHVVPFSYLVRAEPDAAGVQFLSTDPACSGRFLFRTVHASAIVTAIRQARPQ